jgi:hypothetical protein
MPVFVTCTTGFSGSARPGQGHFQALQDALFVSDLQPTDAPTADMVAEAINCTVLRFGVRGCAGRMAQEFGDHPDAAAARMRWVRHLAWATARPQASPVIESHRAASRSSADGLLPNAARPRGSPVPYGRACWGRAAPD